MSPVKSDPRQLQVRARRVIAVVMFAPRESQRPLRFQIAPLTRHLKMAAAIRLQAVIIAALTAGPQTHAVNALRARFQDPPAPVLHKRRKIARRMLTFVRCASPLLNHGLAWNVVDRIF